MVKESGNAPALWLSLALFVPFTASAQGGPATMVHRASPQFQTVIPQGYVAQPDPHDPDIIAIFSHPQRRSILMFLRAGDPMMQGEGLTFQRKEQLRIGDPAPFADREFPVRVLRFEGVALRGEGTVAQGRAVRFVAPVPSKQGTFAIWLGGAATEEPVLRATFERLLVNTTTTTHWRTAGERRVATIAGYGFLAGLVLTLLYGFFYLAKFRENSDLWPGPRAAARAAMGIAWGAHSAWWLTQGPWDSRVMGALLVLFALVNVRAAAILVRAAKDRVESKAP